MGDDKGVLRVDGGPGRHAFHFEDYEKGTCHSIPIRRSTAAVGYDAVDGIVDLNEAFLVMFEDSDGNITIEYSNDKYHKVKSILEELDVEFYSTIEEYNQATC